MRPCGSSKTTEGESSPLSGEDKIAGSFSELSLSGGLAKRCGQRDRTELQVKQNKTSSSYSIVDSANAVKDRQTEGETDGRQIER